VIAVSFFVLASANLTDTIRNGLEKKCLVNQILDA
jgi:hypothetical protein